MSEHDTMQCCASCGIAGLDDIKLKDCDCDLVKYCSDECQEDHRPKHEEECKKRVAELHDEILFEQPEGSHLGDCPICCLPLLIGTSTTLLTCCSKQICTGCYIMNKKREHERKLQHKCEFCREAPHKTNEESFERLIKRVEANDPVAINSMGTSYSNQREYKAAFEYFTRAAALGDANAHYKLSGLYQFGRGVEKDEIKQIHHLKEAAIGGHPHARYNLGCVESENGRMDRAAKHFIIATKLGCDKSLDNLKVLYEAGHVSKDDFDAALCGHQAAIDASTSPQRKMAAKVYDLLIAKREKKGEKSPQKEAAAVFARWTAERERR